MCIRDRDKRIEGISDLNDLSSSRTGMKILVEIKKDANPQVVLNLSLIHISS